MKRYSRRHVEHEYNTSAKLAMYEYEMVKWGSTRSMENRFRLIRELIDFTKVRSVLDVGCGTGRFLSDLAADYPHLRLTGIDLSKRLIQWCRKQHPDSIDFHLEDIASLPDEPAWDVITLMGVLQKTIHEPVDIIRECVRRLSPGGCFFLTTKNIEWKAFQRPGFTPEAGHRWFVPAELVKNTRAAGAEILVIEGFLPHEFRRVPLNDSHTFFILARKLEQTDEDR